MAPRNQAARVDASGDPPSKDLRSNAPTPRSPSREKRPPADPEPLDEASPWADGSIYARLMLAYGASFALTTLAVLSVWFVLLPHPKAVPPAPIVVAAPAPAPAPPPPAPVAVPVPVPVPVPVAVAAAPPARPLPERRPPPPAPVPVAPPPEPTVVVAPAPAPAAPAPPPPAPVAVAPAAATRLAGTYAGRSAGRAFSMSLAFGPDGELKAHVDVPGESATSALGKYALAPDGSATIVLMVGEGGDAEVYAGTVGAGAAEGRVTAGGRNLGRFTAVH